MSTTLVFAILVVIIAVLIPNPRPRPRRRRLNLHILAILTLIPLPIHATNDFPPLPTPPPTSLAAAQLLQKNSACVTLSSALSLCTSLTPGFTTLPPTQQASCLCYTSSTYAPTNFDGAVKDCAEYAITAVPNAYTPILNLEGFCAHLGPASSLGGDSTSICTTTSTSSLYSGDWNGNGNNGAGGGGCNLVSEFLSSCTGLTPSFLQMQSTDQASCLCYASSTIWQPGVFDGAVATCISAAPGSSGMLNSAISSLGGFCAGVGNILASSTVAPGGGGGSMTTIATTATGNGVTVGVAGSGSWNGQTTSMDITVTIGGLLPQQTGSGNKGIRKVQRQEVVGISFVCALLVTFLW